MTETFRFRPDVCTTSRFLEKKVWALGFLAVELYPIVDGGVSVDRFVNRVANFLGLEIMRRSTATRLRSNEMLLHKKRAELRILENFYSRTEGSVLFEMVSHSRAQLSQDLFVLSVLDLQEDGFFVEFGAANGVSLSNTYLLEKNFGWKGILAEPGRGWHSELRKNRKAIVDTRCVWSESGARLDFLEAGEISTVSMFEKSDQHSRDRKAGAGYEVISVSLSDLLDQNDAPEIIDYLSIDTEGSELLILSAFDFSSRQIRVITCEHNFTANREKLHNLLTSNGFRRVFEDVSGWDDWYVHSSVSL